MDTTEIIRDNADSVEIGSNGKGEKSWKIKVYGDSKTEDGVTDIEQRIAALRLTAERVANE